MSLRSEVGEGADLALRATIERRQLAVFLVGSVALGSLATALLAGSSHPLILPLVALAISFIPAGLALLLLRLGRDSEERAALQHRLTAWRLGPRWYVLAVVLMPAAHLAGVALATLGGGSFPLHLERLALLPLFVVANLGEEIGWRGYALPRLQRHLTPLTASVILGMVWAAFHWAALGQNPDRPWAYIAVGSVFLVATSVVMTWVFNHTGGSLVLMVLLHAAYDVMSVGVVPLAETAVPLLAFGLSGAVLSLIALVVLHVDGPQLGRAGHHD